MAVLEPRSEVKTGFSSRLNILLDEAGWPDRGRFSIGARRCRVSHAAFRNWCTTDKGPATFPYTVNVVEEILNDIEAKLDPYAVSAWLLAGDRVPNPFDMNHHAAYFDGAKMSNGITRVLASNDLDFNNFNTTIQHKMLEQVRKKLINHNDRLTIDDFIASSEFKDLVLSMAKLAELDIF